MENVNREKVISLLNEIMKYELAGVVRYTHSALMVVGPYRESLITYFNEQSTESLLHAQSAERAISEPRRASITRYFNY